MKLELNFFTDSDGNHKVAITSPNIKNGVVRRICKEDYEDIIDILSNPDSSCDDFENIIDILSDNLSNTLQIHVWKSKQEDGSNDYVMRAFNYGGYSMTDISNKTYKKFCKGSDMQKLEIAYHAFEEQIKSGIFNH